MEFWMGDEANAQRYAALALNPPLDKIKGAPMLAQSAFEEDRYYGLPAMAQVSGDVAVIKIPGTLIAGEATWRRLYGYIGYEDIKGAIIEALGRSDINSIMLYMDTSGGMVNGVESTAKMIREAGKVKPITAYAATAASAGYWLASAAEYIVADNTSVLASLGSIMQFVNLVEYYAKEGVKYHTFKSGSLKMAGNPVEEMSEEAKKYFQEQVDDMTTIFYAAIARNRAKDPVAMRKEFGDGRAVLGARALAGGLIDELGGMGAALTKARMLAESRGTGINMGNV